MVFKVKPPATCSILFGKCIYPFYRRSDKLVEGERGLRILCLGEAEGNVIRGMHRFAIYTDAKTRENSVQTSHIAGISFTPHLQCRRCSAI